MGIDDGPQGPGGLIQAMLLDDADMAKRIAALEQKVADLENKEGILLRVVIQLQAARDKDAKHIDELKSYITVLFTHVNTLMDRGISTAQHVSWLMKNSGIGRGVL